MNKLKKKYATADRNTGLKFARFEFYMDLTVFPGLTIKPKNAIIRKAQNMYVIGCVSRTSFLSNEKTTPNNIPAYNP